MPVSEGPKGVEQEMHKFKKGELHSGSGHKVTNRKQAIAIALKESGQSKYQSGSMKYHGEGRKTHGS